jgi:hypothetical protein
MRRPARPAAWIAPRSTSGKQVGSIVERWLSMSRTELIETLAVSGWVRCLSIRKGLEQAGLPVPNADYLSKAFSATVWRRAERASAALQAQFADARFADQAVFGLLLVPDPARLDTRSSIDPDLRADQTEITAPDVFDDRLPEGTMVVPPGADWNLVATITGEAGVNLGSYNDIRAAPADAFTVDGVDTRATMCRQLWGARVLQSGDEPPDSPDRERWTFTIFAGEPLVNGEAESGTVLHGRVRFRLGRPDRGIASVRACPALVIR